MKAVRIHEYGGPEVLRLEDIPVPEAGADEALVKIHAAGVNPIDWKIRQGYMDYLKKRSPLTLGRELAGIIEKTGAGVKEFKTGDAIYACPDRSRDGTYAEYITIKEDELAPKPASLDFIQAAGVPLVSQTAWQGLFDHGGLKAGQRVLIHGAAGGVGSFAVQYAKITGAYVYGTASGEGLELLKSLGADMPIDYKNRDFTQVARDVDLVFDLIGGETQARSWDVIKKGGTLVSTVGAADPERARAIGGKAVNMVMKSSAALLRQIGKLFDQGKLRVMIDRVFPLEQAAEAQRMLQDGRARGKLILKVV